MSKIYRPVIPIWIEEEDMRLIDADALKELIVANVYPICDAFNSRDYGMFWTGGIEKAINEMPTIDAVEVVRCKDCTGCRFVGTYDTQFPCANCARKTKDYYEPQTERSE